MENLAQKYQEKQLLNLEPIKIVGIAVVTNTDTEMAGIDSKIGKNVEQYFAQGIPNQIKNRKSPGVTYCAYTDYEDKIHGNYTYFIGEVVKSFADDLPTHLVQLTIPAGQYAKFTSESGEMPAVCIDMWKRIWGLRSDELGGDRAFKIDFEVYDERAHDPKNTVLDIYIGVE